LEKINIAYNNAVKLYLSELVYVLHQKEYFSCYEKSAEYVDIVLGKIHTNLHTIKHHLSNEDLKRYGKYYAKISMNRRTVYIVFFDKKENNYYI
jgi:hypothetical protein